MTKSANDAAVVIAEAIGGDEGDFAKMMTRKARALGMTRTVYRNASGLPDDEQVTTARDQATLGRAIQDRFPRYYRYFATAAFNFHGHTIHGHNHLLGSVEGVDGIKTGYIRASGFNLVTNLRRGNRHLVGVVLGGRSSGSRDATMRNLLAENLDKASTHTYRRRDHRAQPGRRQCRCGGRRGAITPDADGSGPGRSSDRLRSAEPVAQPPVRSVKPSLLAAAAAAVPPAPAKPEPAPFSNGVIQTQPIAAVPGSTEPMKPVRVKTVQIKAGQVKVASAAASQPLRRSPVRYRSAPRADMPETSGAVVAKAEATAPAAEMPPQPANFGTGNGVLGVLPASSMTPPRASQAMAYADPAPSRSRRPFSRMARSSLSQPIPGWIIQVGALESESEARERIEAARNQAHGMLSKADPFTETVLAKGDKKLYRARFAGLDRDQAEAVCRTLKRSEISCITIKN